MLKKVAIINGNGEYRSLFENRGVEVVDELHEADLIQFTGGADVSPDFYLRLPHRATYTQPMRDHAERQIFIQGLALGKPMAGICRGGQFLNVMCGGRMWQHVNNHGIRGTHPMRLRDGRVWDVTSTHHQMMIPSKEGEVIGTADVCSHKETVSKSGETVVEQGPPYSPDIEVVFYPRQRVLCFQPHPEFKEYQELGDNYVELVKDYLF